jgi:hypothetical protein
MPAVTESLDRVKYCAGQMCCQERAFADKRDSCPQDGGRERGESSKREGSMQGKVTQPHEASQPPAGKLHQLASSSGSSGAGQTSGLCSN